MRKTPSPAPAPDADDARVQLRSLAMDLVAATRRFLEWVAIPEDSFHAHERLFYLGHAPRRLSAAVVALEEALRPGEAKVFDAPKDPEEIKCFPSGLEWAAGTIRHAFDVIRYRWEEELERYWLEMSEAYAGYDEYAEDPDEADGGARASAGGPAVEEPTLPARRLSPQEAARLWHAAAALDAWLGAEGDPPDPGLGSEWIAGTKADLNEALDRSRNYTAYLEKLQSLGELQVMRYKNGWAIRIKDEARREAVRAKLAELRGE